jgi:hypothetical protein
MLYASAWKHRALYLHEIEPYGSSNPTAKFSWSLPNSRLDKSRFFFILVYPSSLALDSNRVRKPFGGWIKLLEASLQIPVQPDETWNTIKPSCW